MGVLELLDPDGELDGLRSLGWDGAPLMLMRGEPDAAYSTFSTVARLTTAGLRYNVRKKEVLLRDLAWRLNQAELHGQRYGGTGATDGDPSLAGQIKPLAIGTVFNISPVQINATGLVYQVSCSSVLAIDAVRDGGAPLSFSADYGTYDLLAAATVSPGAYSTCIAQGLFRIGSGPVYLITADVRGDNDVIAGLSYPHKATSFMLQLTADGVARTWTWPASVTWISGVPTLTSVSGKADLFVFFTLDGGTTWLGSVVAQNY